MRQYVECKTVEDLQRIIAAGDIAVLREGYWTITGSATVEASGSATVRASGSATVRAWGSATVEASGSATVRALARAIVQVLSSAVTVEASDWTTVVLHAAAKVVAEASVVVVEQIIRSVQDWVHAYGAKRRDDKLVLFKWVDTEGCGQMGFRYPEGETVEAPDWDPNPARECGGGLHACASLIDAEQFRDKPRLAVELLVDPADCRCPQPGDEYPNKLRFRRAYVARVWDPEKEGASGQAATA